MKNVWICISVLVVMVMVGCTQSGPMYSFIPVNEDELSTEQASKIDAVVLDMGDKGFSTKEVAFTTIKTGNQERIFVSDKDGVTKGRVIAEAVGGASNGVLSATTLGWWQYRAAGRQSDNIAGGGGGKGIGTGVGVVGDNNDISTGN